MGYNLRSKKHKEKLQKRKIRARKSIEKRLRFLQTSKIALQGHISGLETRIENFKNSSWIANFISKELDLAQTRKQSSFEELKLLNAEIAGVQIELARVNKQVESQAVEISDAA